MQFVQVEGGVCAAEGFSAASCEANIKYKNRTDMAMVFSKVPAECAGTFTTNLVKAACVQWDQKIVESRTPVPEKKALMPVKQLQERWRNILA